MARPKKPYFPHLTDPLVNDFFYGPMGVRNQFRWIKEHTDLDSYYNARKAKGKNVTLRNMTEEDHVLKRIFLQGVTEYKEYMYEKLAEKYHNDPKVHVPKFYQFKEMVANPDCFGFLYFRLHDKYFGTSHYAEALRNLSAKERKQAKEARKAEKEAEIREKMAFVKNGDATLEGQKVVYHDPTKVATPKQPIEAEKPGTPAVHIDYSQDIPDTNDNTNTFTVYLKNGKGSVDMILELPIVHLGNFLKQVTDGRTIENNLTV